MAGFTHTKRKRTINESRWIPAQKHAGMTGWRAGQTDRLFLRTTPLVPHYML